MRQGSLKLEPLEAAFDFLVRAHALGLVYPAPLQEPVTEETPTFYFSLFGQRAQFASAQRPATRTELPLRTITHPPAPGERARGRTRHDHAPQEGGLPIAVPGPQGATPLHWAVAATRQGPSSCSLRGAAPSTPPTR